MRAALLLSAALIVSPAYAQSSASNNQYQLRGVTAETEVETNHAGEVGATSVASGNAVTGVTTDTDVSYTSTQHMDGDTSAATDATAWYVEHGVAVTSAAVANGATATSEDGDMDIASDQLAHGDVNAAVTARTGDTGWALTGASAAGNVGAFSSQNGQFRGILSQESMGNVSTTIEADHDIANGPTVSGAVASANDINIAGDTATILTDTTQTARGSVRVQTDTYVGLGDDVSGNATAAANNVVIDNAWGYVNSRARHNSDASVEANSYVTLGGDFLGVASAGAYGVGNGVTVSNVGSDTVLDIAQVNSGGVSSNAALIGEGGDYALASSASYGNSISAGLCNYCDASAPELHAATNQVNDGDVSSRASVNAPRARTVAATSTAIGNAATFQSNGPN